jgi:hypothetical protein
MNLIHTGKKRLLNVIFSSFITCHTGWGENYGPISPIVIPAIMHGNYKNQVCITVVVRCRAQQPSVGP